jgi:serine/threonine-protein kinase
MNPQMNESKIKASLPEKVYRVDWRNPIGKGGQKQAYIADVDGYDFSLVLKIIFPSSDSLDRIKREIRAVECIRHENIPQIFESNIDSVTDSSQIVWLLEERVHGQSLRTIIQNQYVFTLKNVVNFLDVMLSVLEVTEKNNIVHRDIKPDNIMLDDDGKYWLLDFGIARHLDLESLTLTNSPFGLFTVGYSASEQFRNRKKDIDIRADLFSLGVVVTEMIQGYNPYLHEANDILQVIKRIEQYPLPALRINGDDQFMLARFIKMLGDNRISRRPSSVAEAQKIFEIVKSTLKM